MFRCVSKINYTFRKLSVTNISNKLTCENRLTLIFSYFDAVQIRKSCHAEDSGFSAMFSVAHTQKVTFSASHNTYLVTAFDGV